MCFTFLPGSASYYSLCITLIVCLWIRGLIADKNYYRAAVLEHVRFINASYPPKEIIQKNLEAYEIAAKTAALNGADIIVFPEWGLYPHKKENRSYLYDFIQDVPDPKKEASNPCDEKNRFQNRSVLRELSCMAKKNGLYIVANIADVKKCQKVDTCDPHAIECNSDENKCPEDGQFIFNTNVVFNREGDLITRYYKRHLFFELDINPPNLPDDAYFQTEFGNFTTVICFDLMFYESILAVEKSGVANLAYPTYWFDHVPFIYFATPNQQAWAFTNKINLLAANVQYPGTGTVGSGIYSADRGALIYTHNPDGLSKLLMANVPISIGNDETDSFPVNPQRFIFENGEAVEVDVEEKEYFHDQCLVNVLGEAKDPQSDYRCLPSQLGNYDFVKLEKSEGHLEMCSNDFCCSLSYKADSLEEDFFFGVAGRTLTAYNVHTYGIEGCFLSRCESLDARPCANYGLKSNVIFQNVELVGNFSSKYVFPFSVDSGVRLTNRNNWTFDRNSSMKYRNFDGSNLLFFGLYGRRFDLDKSTA